MNQPIDIFVTCFLRQSFTEQTIKYLHERTKYPFRLFVIDNGGNQEVLDEAVKQKLVFLVIRPSSNIGIHASWNLALAMAESDYFITSDNDILVPNLNPDWLEQMVGIMREREVDHLAALALQPHVFIGTNPTAYPSDGTVIDMPIVGAVMRMMNRQAVENAKGWEHVIRTSRNHEEHTICDRLRNLQYKMGYTAKMKAFHLFGSNEQDPWGYPKSMKPADHGHREISPPVNIFGNMADYNNKTWEPLK
jgi:GT2 family glycosyltransferase